MEWWSLLLHVTMINCYLCVQVPRQPTGPPEAASPIRQLHPQRWPHGSRPLQGGDRHCWTHPARHHIHHSFCLHLLLYTLVQLPLNLLCTRCMFKHLDSPHHYHLFAHLTIVKTEKCQRMRAKRAVPFCVHKCLGAKVVPVCCRDNPHMGTLHTAVRMQPPNHRQLASTNISSGNKHTHSCTQTHTPSKYSNEFSPARWLNYSHLAPDMHL